MSSLAMSMQTVMSHKIHEDVHYKLLSARDAAMELAVVCNPERAEQVRQEMEAYVREKMSQPPKPSDDPIEQLANAT